MFLESITIQSSIPYIFRKHDTQLYPSDNFPDFEFWLSQNLKEDEIKSDRIYLPITFTAFYKTCRYGQDLEKLKLLTDYLKTLDTTKKYFTVIQWDDGILNDISHLYIKVFSMAGGRKDYGLPLICQPHKIKFNNKRDIFCSFVGRITNPIRQEIVNAYSGKKDYFVSTKDHSLPDYCRILSRSVFGLCPAGYGSNSFRIQECLEYGVIPVWVTNEMIPIHDIDFLYYGYWVSPDKINKIDLYLNSIPKEEIELKQSRLKEVFDNYFTFEANKKLILENI